MQARCTTRYERWQTRATALAGTAAPSTEHLFSPSTSLPLIAIQGARKEMNPQQLLNDRNNSSTTATTAQ
jgi:hypothetical protein